MKKILLLTLLIFLFPLKVLSGYLVLPSDFIVGKVENINNSLDINYSKVVKLENYIHYKLPNFGNIFSYNLPINYNISVSNYGENLNIKKGDIVILSPSYSKKYPHSISINKVFCNNGKIKFNPNYISGFSENSTDEFYKAVSLKINCKNLESFFNKDKRFQDLGGMNLKALFFGILGFLILILGIILFLRFKFVNRGF